MGKGARLRHRNLANLRGGDPQCLAFRYVHYFCRKLTGKSLELFAEGGISPSRFSLSLFVSECVIGRERKWIGNYRYTKNVPNTVLQKYY